MTGVIGIHLQAHKEAQMIAGTYSGNSRAQYKLYKYCADYYYEKYRALFSAPAAAAEEIFQNSFIKLWENIEARKIYAEGSVVRNKDGVKLNCSILTYFMGIARLKYMEWVKQYPLSIDLNTEMGRLIKNKGFDEEKYLDELYGESDNIQLDIIGDLIPNLSPRCYEIISKYYYEGKNLDRIIKEIPSIESKNALKTKKHKCMENLRLLANETYNRYLQYN